MTLAINNIQDCSPAFSAGEIDNYHSGITFNASGKIFADSKELVERSLRNQINRINETLPLTNTVFTNQNLSGREINLKDDIRRRVIFCEELMDEIIENSGRMELNDYKISKILDQSSQILEKISFKNFSIEMIPQNSIFYTLILENSMKVYIETSFTDIFEGKDTFYTISKDNTTIDNGIGRSYDIINYLYEIQHKI